MAGHSKDPLLQFSAGLASATASAQPLIVAIRAPRSPPLSGTLWRNNLVVASEQVFPRADAAEIVQTDGAAIRARVLHHLREIMGKLKLTVNEDKTRICKVPEGEFDFLGFTFGQMFSRTTGQARLALRPSKKSIQRMVETVHG